MRFATKGLYRLAVVTMAAWTLSGCSNPAPTATTPTGLLQVTATTGMIADAARIVGGDHAQVTGLMGPGVDPHLYQATQSDLGKLSNADLIMYNGLHLEGRMADVLVNMASRVRTVQVTDSIPQDRLRTPPEFDGHYDPHVWFDVSLWRYAVERIRDAFVEADPAHQADYEANAAAYLTELDALHIFATDEFASVPEANRILVTAHDAFGYLGAAYGVEVHGLQGISTASEFGLQDVTNLVDMIVERKIRAVFVESSVSPRSIEALVEGAKARGHDLRIGGELFSDALGADGTPEGHYTGMVRHNVTTIVEALK